MERGTLPLRARTLGRYPVDYSYWHETDLSVWLGDVRFQGRTDVPHQRVEVSV
jgi:hypothetical protein